MTISPHTPHICQFSPWENKLVKIYSHQIYTIFHQNVKSMNLAFDLKFVHTRVWNKYEVWIYLLTWNLFSTDKNVTNMYEVWVSTSSLSRYSSKVTTTGLHRWYRDHIGVTLGWNCQLDCIALPSLWFWEMKYRVIKWVTVSYWEFLR